MNCSRSIPCSARRRRTSSILSAGGDIRADFLLAMIGVIILRRIEHVNEQGLRRGIPMARPLQLLGRMAARKSRVEAAAVPAEELAGEFPDLDLPVRPPYPPMEA